MTKQLAKLFVLVIVLQVTCIGYSNAQTGTWTALRDSAPHANLGVCLLLTDGSVICHNSHGGADGTGWDRLTPDIYGSYVNGSWDTIASMHYDRVGFSSQVLPSGKVYVAGGEHGSGGPYGEVYDPVTNTWTMCGSIPSGWNLYDAPSELLYDGTILEGDIIHSPNSYDCLLYNQGTNSFTITPPAPYWYDESAWLKLPDSSVLFIGMPIFFSYNSCRYIPQLHRWINDSTVPGNVYDNSEETGPAFLLPNGKAIFFGGATYNAIYTPTGDTNRGVWSSAATFPQINGTYMGQPDYPGAMMTNGRILCAVSPVNSGNGANYFLEYDYVANSFTQVRAIIPTMGGDSMVVNPGCMLDLPDGNVLLSIEYSNKYFIYTPGSPPIPQGKPTIDNVIPDGCSFFKITGKLFNGISEGAAYGDDWQMATNYPLVRLTNGTNMYYAKTTNWNRIGFVASAANHAADSLEDTAYFTLPASLPGGTFSVVVVANGFASNPVLLGTEFGVSISSQTNIYPCNGGNNGSATAFPADGTPPYTYLWMPGGGTNATLSNLSAGAYTVTVTGFGGGCSVSAIANITQPATLVVTGSGVNTTSNTFCNGQTRANIVGGTPGYNYLWSPGGATTATVTGQCAGTYCCTVTDANGCTASNCVTIVSTAGIDEVQGESEKVKVYPNPNNGKFNVIVNSKLSMVNEIQVYNVMGQEISQFTIYNSQFSIDLSSQPNGVYLYRVIEKDGSLLGEGKLIIEK